MVRIVLERVALTVVANNSVNQRAEHKREYTLYGETPQYHLNIDHQATRTRIQLYDFEPDQSALRVDLS